MPVEIQIVLALLVTFGAPGLLFWFAAMESKRAETLGKPLASSANMPEKTQDEIDAEWANMTVSEQALIVTLHLLFPFLQRQWPSDSAIRHHR
jgi:hypothetical protein